MIEGFEKFAARSSAYVRFDKEAYEFWPRGIIYQHGGTNELFKAFCAGYAMARCVYVQGG